MNGSRRHKRLQFLSLFFVPVALALIMVAVFNHLTERHLQQDRRTYDLQQQQDLQSAAETSAISLQTLVLQQELTDALTQAQSGRIDEAGAYRLHSHIVDRVADFEKRMGLLDQVDLGPDQVLAWKQARAAFDDFKRFLLMSTDLAAVDTHLAGRQLITAHQHYVVLAMRLQGINEHLTQRAQQHRVQAAENIDATRLHMQALNALAIVLMLACWLMVANWLAKRLETLSAALDCLSGPDGAPEAGSQYSTLFHELHLGTYRGGLVGEMTRAVLAYRDARIQRQLALNELEAERTQLHALIQGMPDLVWLKDREGAYQVFNQRFLHQTGRKAESVKGKHDADLFPPDEAQRYLNGDQLAIDTGRYELPPHWRTFADGHRELVIAIKTAIHDARGQLLGVLGVGRDITALHEAQQALADRERQYASIVSQAPIGIVLIDLSDLSFINFNEAACQALGYAREEFSRLRLYDLQAGLSAEELDEQVRHIVDADGLAFESRQRLQNGEERDFWVSMRPLELKGRPCLTGVWMDVTERKRIERELQSYQAELEHRVADRTASLQEAGQRLSEQALQLSSANSELRAIFDNATVGIVILQNRRVVRCNRKIEEIFGYAEHELLHRSTRLWYGSDAEFEAIGQQVVIQHAGPGPHVREQEMCRRDGNRFWARVTDAPIDIPAYPNATIGIVEDVTSEHRIADELRLTRDLAESANRAKSSFLANMSHEIRTPMNAIIGLAHLVRRDPLTKRQTQQLDKLSDAAMHLLAIINDILDFSKIEAGKMTLDPVDFQTERVVSNVFALVAERAESKGLELVAEIGGVPRMMHGDGVRLGQILLNFVNNAVKFTERGSVCLRGWQLPDRADGRQWLRFEVRDTGIGISDEQQKRLFNSFEQADTSTTRLYGGTGLGLAISRRLADLLGGQVGVRSAMGQGSTFWLELPLDLAPDHDIASPQPLPERSRVLVIDDMEEARESLADLLASLGARVERASSGALALERVAQADAQGDPISIVFSDWLMPGLNGTQTCERIRQLPLRTQPVCILVSGSSGCPSEIKEGGVFSAFIPKPVLPALLSDAITHALAREHPGKSSSALASSPDKAPPQFEPGHTVLLVEDNPMNQEVALEWLQDLGFRVDLAENGQQAIESARQHHYELVLMDVQMPVLDGLEATRQIRQLPGWERIPILAMTANAFAEDRAVALAAGMDDHVPKPVDPAVLKLALAKWLPDALLASASKPGVPAADAASEAATAQDAELRQRLNLISCLDIDAGSRSMRGDLQRLRSYLMRFAAEHGEDMESIRRDLSHKDQGSARRQLHTLKSLAGMLGLLRIQHLAQTAEQQCVQPDASDFEASMRALDQALSDSCQEIQHRLGGGIAGIQAIEPPVGTESVAADLTPVRAPLSELRALLAADDLDSVEAFEQLRSQLVALDPTLCSQLSQAIDGFEFPQALALLDTHLGTP